MAQSPDFFLESDTNAEELANITAVLFNPALRIGYPIIAVICAALAVVALFFHFWFYAFLALFFTAFVIKDNSGFCSICQLLFYCSCNSSVFSQAISRSISATRLNGVIR